MNVKDQTMEVTLNAGADGKQAQYSVAYTDPAATTAFLDQYNVVLRRHEPQVAVVDERASSPSCRSCSSSGSGSSS